jgi:hypothetical protein
MTIRLTTQNKYAIPSRYFAEIKSLLVKSRGMKRAEFTKLPDCKISNTIEQY